ncbi:hypothetical protein GSI_03698 [Ganoderma sinense ZZ0214-1]|uniref:Uncharacterized protein n=1 Tax=Ganoderma sinense ZZ0214-1 TaxID=1077348 RepID=A0A2G8SJR9_9APHY|nr:hypothetical protein GSI_03698 [Ganoderma sinense ZZ0214-1]
MNVPQSIPTAFDESPLLTRDQAQGEFDDMTRECFEYIERSLGRAIGDLAIDIGSGNETADLLQAKLTTIVDELIFFGRFPSRFEGFEWAFHQVASIVATAPVEYRLAPHFAEASAGLHVTALDRFHRWRVEDATRSSTNMDLLDSVFFHVGQLPVSWYHRMSALRRFLILQVELATRECTAFLNDHPELDEDEPHRD